MHYFFLIERLYLRSDQGATKIRTNMKLSHMKKISRRRDASLRRYVYAVPAKHFMVVPQIVFLIGAVCSLGAAMVYSIKSG